MRVVGGKLKGRRFNPPKKLPVRPTTDFAKEGLFNLLRNHISIEDISVLDLFSGTGNMSLEFFSHGANAIVAIDRNGDCVRYLKELSAQLNISEISVYRNDVFKALKRFNQQFDLIFADPPYEMTNIEQIAKDVFQLQLLKNEGILIVEHGPRTNLSELEHFQFS